MMINKKNRWWCLVGWVALLGCLNGLNANAARPARQADMFPAADMIGNPANDALARQWADSVMRRMNLKERIGQLMVYTLDLNTSKPNLKRMSRVIADYHVGGLLFSKGSLNQQARLTNMAQDESEVPLLITFDGEWGLSMRLKDAPTFPVNRVLGCITDDNLIYAYGREVAREMREIGVHVNFAPVADVDNNPNNPVINFRSFGQDPVNVSNKVNAYVKGLQDGGVLAVCKHFPGHGDTDVDSHKALPRIPFSRQRLDSVELFPFRKAIEQGVGGIMVGHLEVPSLEPTRGLPSSLSPQIVTKLLTNEMGFKGLVFTDALEMRGVSQSGDVCLKALQAGCDLLLVPGNLKAEFHSIVQAVKEGAFPEAEIDRRCQKVLMYKYALGLSRKPAAIHYSGLVQRVESEKTQELIRSLNLAAVTVLTDETQVLPLDPSLKRVAVVHVGENENILGPFLAELKNYTEYRVFGIRRTDSEAAVGELQQQLASFDRVIVCVSDPSAAQYRSFLSGFDPRQRVVYVLFAQTKGLEAFRSPLSKAQAVILAHTADEQVQSHVARLLYADANANGRLSTDVFGLFKTGQGLDFRAGTRPRFVPEEHGVDSRLLARIDSIALEGMVRGAYPGCQVVVMKDGGELYNKTFGYHTWNEAGRPAPLPVSATDVYDLASLSKTSGVLLAVMKLYDEGKILLSDRLSKFLPYLNGTNKQDLSVRELLFHESGLPSSILFYQEAINPKSYKKSLFSGKKDKLHPVQLDATTWINPHYQFVDGLISAVPTATHTLQVCDSMWIDQSFKEVYKQKIAAAPLGPKKYLYSDVNFILLQQVVEACSGMPLDAYLEKTFYAPMGLARTGFLPLRRLSKDEVVPSNVDNFLRRRVIQGFVHDEAAAFQGGVSGNAGLFSSATEVAKIYQMLLNGGELDGKRYLTKATCDYFTSAKSTQSHRGLGFDKPNMASPTRGNCGLQAPASVYGHTGFTGTCAWVDPDNGLVYVFLSNRTYPDRGNSKLSQLDIRTRIQDAIYDALLNR